MDRLPSRGFGLSLAFASTLGCGDSIQPATDAGPDAAPPVQITLELAESEMTVSEVDELVEIELIVRTDGPSTDVAAEAVVEPIAQTATADLDFNSTPQVINIPPATRDGARLRVEIAIADDLSVEGPESFAVRLSPGSNVDVDPEIESRVTILDDDEVRLLGLRTHLIELDVATGREAAIGRLALRGVEDVGGIDVHPESGLLYAIDGRSELWAIDLATGLWTFVTSIGAASYSGMSFGTGSDLWAVDSFDQQLYKVDLETKLTTPIGGPLGVGIRDVAFDSSNDVLYGFRGNVVYTIDRTTGVATELGTVVDSETGQAMRPVHGCDIHAAAQVAYCTTFGPQAVAVDLETRTSAPVFNPEFLSSPAIALGPGDTSVIAADDGRFERFDLENQVLTRGRLGLEFLTTLTSAGTAGELWTVSGDSLVRVNLETGDLVLGPATDPDLQALSRDPTSGALVGGLSSTTQDRFGLVDPTTGSITPLDIDVPSVFSFRALTHHPTTGQLWVSSASRLGRVVDGRVEEFPDSRSYDALVFTSDGRLLGTTRNGGTSLLHEISTVTGIGVEVQSLPFFTSALAHDHGGGRFVGVGAARTQGFFDLSLETGRVTTYDGLPSSGGLAIDAPRGRIYTAVSGHLFHIDPSTSRATSLFDLGDLELTGLAVDPASGLLWGVEVGLSDQRVVTINPQTGTVELVGIADVLNPLCLAFAPNGALVSAGFNDHSLFTIDPTTGVGALAPTPFPADLEAVRALASDQVGRLLGVDELGRIVEIDPLTGVTSPVGQISSGLGGLDLQR